MQSAILSDHINDLFKLCLQLENKFINLKPHMKKHIKVLRLRIRALHLVFLMKATNKSALNSTEFLLNELDGLQKEEDIIQDFAFVKDLLHSLMDESQRKAGILVRILQPLLFKYPMESLDFDDHIKMAHAVIFEPIGNNDTPLKYTAGMTHFCSRIAYFFDCGHNLSQGLTPRTFLVPSAASGIGVPAYNGTLKFHPSTHISTNHRTADQMSYKFK